MLPSFFESEIRTLQFNFVVKYVMKCLTIGFLDKLWKNSDPLIVLESVGVNQSVEHDLTKGNAKNSNKPEINHFDVACFWQAVGHTDEQRCQDKQ